MPTIIINGYKFRLYSSDFLEPPHVHIIRGDNVAKVWLEPVRVAHNRGYNQPTLNKLLKLTEAHKSRLLETWYAYFNPK